MDWNNMWSAIPTAGAAIVVGVMTWLGTRASASSRREEAEITTRGEEWQMITTAIQKYADKRIADQDLEIGKQGSKITSLEGKVNHLERENELTKTKYWQAIFYGRAWRLLHPESITLIEVPPEIAPDL